METLAAGPGGMTSQVIVVTASHPTENRDRAVELGAIGYFQKPFETGDLIDAVEAALGPA